MEGDDGVSFDRPGATWLCDRLAECVGTFDELDGLIDWNPVAELLRPLGPSDQGRAGLASVGDVQGAVAIGLV